MTYFKNLLFLAAIWIYSGCKHSAVKETPLFTTLHAEQTGITFKNKLTPSIDLNMLKYMYYYNGAGVAAGDFNNDGRIDLFFASNQQQNSLFLNEGSMHFKDVTKEAGIPNDHAWSTGVSVVDINNDGMLDLYICRVSRFRSLNGSNQLLVCKRIANGIPQYEEEAEKYGIFFAGFSTQAAFFDYDLDGDLDMFLLNHSVNHTGNFAPRPNFLNTYDSLTGDQFFKNENGHFVNITTTVGINSSKIGYGLGVAISDVNLDGWPDIYVGNDFHENDYLYINQKNGIYKEEIEKHLMHTSQFSMGVDIADINNDAYPEIISMDMLPDDPGILKSSLGEDDYETNLNKLRIGYNYQYSRNNLQLNRRNGMFSEIAFYSGISATDWSWACLWMDFDNDGYKDLFIGNGIPKRLNDIDYVTYLVNDAVQQKIQTNTLDENEMAAIYKFPEIKLPNRFFKNTGNATFKDVGNQVNGSPKTFSNGAVYADLDNDGDLDIVVNNINDPVLIYQNDNNSSNHHTAVTLNGNEFNRNAIGARMYLFSKDSILSFEKFGTRGFLSSMEIPLQIGTGKMTIDSARMVWPDNTCQSLLWDSSATSLSLQWKPGLPKFNIEVIKNHFSKPGHSFTDITAQSKLTSLHQENNFNEYNREPLLIKMLGSEGPALAVGDLNGDGLDDVYVGNSKWKKGELFFQNALGIFIKSNQQVLLKDSTYEDVDAVITDVNNDHFNDLIIASAGNEFYGKEPWLQPRIYLNDGKGMLYKMQNPFPGIYTTQSCIKAFDFNLDGFVDFFIGGRATAFQYGKPTNSYLMQNDGTGHFKDATALLGADVQVNGFVTNAAWADIDNDDLPDLIITREWGTIEGYLNKRTGFKKKELIPDKGWWNVVLPVDVDNDGDIDLIAGNQGENFRVKVADASPMKMYFNDFDNNGTKEQLVTYYQHGKEIPLATKMDLEKQMPYLRKKFLYASDFAKASLTELFDKTKLEGSILYTANNFSSMTLINDGKGNFTAKPLPWEAQLSCVRDAAIVYAKGKKLPDIIIGGNFYDQAMQLNRNDADFGTILVNQGNGSFTASQVNGVSIKNQIRHIRSIIIKGKPSFVIARNNDSLLLVQ